VTTTKQRLLSAAAEALRDDGISGLSARTIAARAGANQALIFYHYRTVSELVAAATRAAVDERRALYREEFARVDSLPQLLDLGRRLHEREREAGNVRMMAQLMAGAQQDAVLAEAGRYAMQAWTDEVEGVLRRVLAPSPLSLIADPEGLAKAVSASFIGIQLFDGVDPSGAAGGLDALEQLGVLVDVVDELGPVARRALRAKVRKRGRKSDTAV
jgi:AcrR family transcriptional regulator